MHFKFLAFLAPLFLIIILGLAGSPQAFADDAWSKFGRGFSNLVFGVTELGKQPFEMAKTEPWPVAFFGGLGKGAVMMLLRMGAGIYEVVTFPIPWPNGYDPIIEPEFPVYPKSHL